MSMHRVPGLSLSILIVVAGCGGSHTAPGDAGPLQPSDSGPADSGTGTCTTTMDCPLGSVCSNATCVLACTSDADCSSGSCDVQSGLCVTTAPADAGVPRDAGTPPPDAGAPPVDAGTMTPDSGAPEDAGTPLLDAGMPPLDAGMPGVDAGTSEDAGTCVVSLDAGEGIDAGLASGNFPQVTSGGGPVLTNPHIVAIFFTGDDDSSAPISQLQDFYKGIGSSQYWAALGEYGLGVPSAVTVVTTAPSWTSSSPTVTDNYPNSQLETWLAGMINNGTDGTPPNVVGSTLYVINYPAGVTVSQDGDPSCTTFGGYHSDMQLSSNQNCSTPDSCEAVAYAVIPRCPTESGAPAPFNTDLGILTTTASHELIEGSTDPYPDYQPGLVQADNAHIFWDEANSGSEIGDMCQNDPEAYYQFCDFGFPVQRFWSNASAAAGHDPCVPLLPNEVFFNSVSLLPDTGAFNDYYGTNYTVDSVNIAVGSTGTANIQLYSDGDTGGPWQVQVFDYDQWWLQYCTDAQGNSVACSAALSFSFPSCGGATSCTAESGTIPVSIKVNAAGNPNYDGQPTNTELFVIQSCLGTAAECNSDNPPTLHFWWGIVTN